MILFGLLFLFLPLLLLFDLLLRRDAIFSVLLPVSPLARFVAVPSLQYLDFSNLLNGKS